MSMYDIYKAVGNPPLDKPVNDSDDKCNFCGDPNSGRHSIWLPMRYKGKVVCDNCAAGHSVVTECCGYIGDEND
jgi:hypothetical protein